MDGALQEGAGKRFGGQVAGTYGMSETTGSVCTLPRWIEDKTGSVGIMHPNTSRNRKRAICHNACLHSKLSQNPHFRITFKLSAISGSFSQ